MSRKSRKSILVPDAMSIQTGTARHKIRQKETFFPVFQTKTYGTRKQKHAQTVSNIMLAYVLLYVDDALSIHHDGTGVLKQIDFFFRMKPGSVSGWETPKGAVGKWRERMGVKLE